MSITEVRLAGPEDTDRVYDFLVDLHKENGLFELDRSSARNVIERGTHHDGGLIYIIEHKNEIRASIGLVMDRHWYSDQWYLLELWTYINPKYRTYGYVDILIDKAKESADRLHIPLQIGVLSTHRTDAKVRLYQRKMPFAGAFFFYEPKNGRG